MSFKRTWLWLLVALGLAAFIFFYLLPKQRRPSPTARVLPDLRAGEVTALVVNPKGQKPIRVERTKEGWRLTKPVEARAAATNVDALLFALERLAPTARIRERDLKNPFNLDEEFGFADPQASLIIEQGGYGPRLQIGSATPPGNQIYLQVIGQEPCVASAELLKLIPRQASDWRDRRLLVLTELPFDRIAVTNGLKSFLLQRDGGSGLWRLATSGRDDWLRAHNGKIRLALKQLERLRVQKFVSDDPRADLDVLGLQPPELQLGLSEGTNPAVVLQFGKNPTNDPSQIYARRSDQNTVVTVASEPLAAWHDPINDFRDPHLVELTTPVTAIEVHGEGDFTVQEQTNGDWRVLAPTGKGFEADTHVVKEMLVNLTNLQIVEYRQDNVTDLALAEYGLASPQRRYLMKGATNQNVLVELQFGTNQNGTICVRRADERSVYTVKLSDANRLPAASWQLRKRRLWSMSESDVDRVVIRAGEKSREIARKSAYDWSLAPGSQGIVEPVRVEEAVRGLVQASALAWEARAPADTARFGIGDQSLQVTMVLKNGQTHSIRFGKEAPTTNPYAAVTRDGELWILEFPFTVFRDVFNYLAPK